MKTNRLDPFLCTLVAGLIAVSCSKNDGQPNPSPGAPLPVPTAAPPPNESGEPESDLPWQTVQLFRSYTGSETCDSIELKISKPGTFETKHCDQVSQGPLAEDEVKKLHALVDAALNETLPNPCPELLKLDADYVTIQPDPASPDVYRKFDPDGACYSGGAREVKALRAELRALRKSITGYEP